MGSSFMSEVRYFCLEDDTYGILSTASSSSNNSWELHHLAHLILRRQPITVASYSMLSQPRAGLDESVGLLAFSSFSSGGTPSCPSASTASSKPVSYDAEGSTDALPLHIPEVAGSFL